MRAEKGPPPKPNLRVFALWTALTTVAFSAYWAGVVIIEEASDIDGFKWATFAITIVWLLALGVLAIRVRVNASLFWVGLGAIAGFVLSPVIVFTVFAITYEIWEWPKSLEMD